MSPRCVSSPAAQSLLPQSMASVPSSSSSAADVGLPEEDLVMARELAQKQGIREQQEMQRVLAAEEAQRKAESEAADTLRSQEIEMAAKLLAQSLAARGGKKPPPTDGMNKRY